MRSRRELSEGWTVRPCADSGPGAAVGRIPATVPGAVHLDLRAAGLIPDPLAARHEAEVDWVGRSGWTYARDLVAAELGSEGPGAEERVRPGDRLDLVFEGIDTAATVRLDGEPVLLTENMHRSYRVDATELLTRDRPHWLEVEIESPWTAAHRHRDRLGDLPGAYATPYNFLRTMACSFGWDWGPTLPGAALWRPVALESWSTARLAAVRPDVRVDEVDTGTVRIVVELERTRPDAVGLVASVTRPDGRAIRVGAEVPAGATTAVLEIAVPEVGRWWPHTYGEPVLHRLEVGLSTPDGEPLDSWVRDIGFRTIVLDTSEDEMGTGFTLVVNGRPVFVRGVNWIPDDPFPARITAQRYADRLDEVVELGADLVRVWGGGLYESDAFYEVCDRRGILVWQDFLFACAAYPEEEPFATEVAAEAAEAITRLMPHASLALWCGNNENLWGHVDWGWAPQTRGRTWGEGYYLELLPALVRRIDPTRAYWPGSPWSGSASRHPNDPDHGCSHEWEVWNRQDMEVYRDRVPRFLSEFGWQAGACWRTLRDALDDEPLTADSPGLRAHQKAEGGDAKLARGLARHAGDPVDGPDWVYRTQVVQARAVTVGIEHFRSHRGRCMGTVWWQLNDLWPAVSWSVVDSAGRRKLAWYALRRAYRPRLLTIQPRADGLSAVLVNDGPAPWPAELVADRLDRDGAVVASWSGPALVPAHDVLEIPLPGGVHTPGDPASEVLRVRDGVDEGTGWWWYADGEDLALPAPRAEVTPVDSRDGPAVRVRALTFLRDLALLPDLVHPGAVLVGDNLRTLAPGDTVELALASASATPHDLAAALARALTAPGGARALRCLGDDGITFALAPASPTGVR